jgi:hypothetical protein
LTEPKALKSSIAPVGDSLTSTLLGVAPWPGSQFRFDAVGTVARSAGNSTRNEAAVPPTTVTFIDTAVAPAGTLQLPTAPVTCWVIVSAGPSGAVRGPTVSGAGR